MTTDTDISYADCRCGHDHASHFADGFAPQCIEPRCECLQYRPVPTEPAKLHRVNDNNLSLDQLVAAGKRSSTKRIAALANRINDMAGRLRDAVEQERVNAEATREIARLERELAAAKAKLKTTKHKTTKAAATPDRGVAACPDCRHTFDTPQGLGAHRARKHGYRRTAQ